MEGQSHLPAHLGLLQKMTAFEISSAKTSVSLLWEQLTKGKLLLSCLFELHPCQALLHPSLPAAEEEAQAGVIEAGNAGDDGQPVQETQVSTYDQKHLKGEEGEWGVE